MFPSVAALSPPLRPLSIDRIIDLLEERKHPVANLLLRMLSQVTKYHISTDMDRLGSLSCVGTFLSGRVSQQEST